MWPLKPKGAIPVGLSPAGAAATTTCASGCGEKAEHKKTYDVMTGITQVLSRRTLMQLNYSFTRSSGYLTDPYKIVSLVDPDTGSTLDYVYEKRPAKRLANSLYFKAVHHLDEDVIHLSYRYFTDDWGITAHTGELQYRYKVSETVYLEPQYRYHVQTEADFYHHSLVEGRPLPAFASADLRLGAMTATTVGLKVGKRIGEGELSLRYAVMTETGDSHPSDAIGVQKQVDLYPKLEATIWNLGFSMPL